jgi:FtsH-binding integral membrane protein
MDRNPYAPPASPVADPTEVRTERPKEVTQAVRFLWISLVVSLGAMFFQPTLKNMPPTQWTIVLVVFAVVFALWAWVISRIAAGRNWARVTFFVLTVIGLLFTVVAIPASMPVYKARPLSAVLGIANLVLEIWAFYLLLTTPAREWFKAMRT